jgi:beta-phosphoglucomutase-like phosphatase (HAD superfamily)
MNGPNNPLSSGLGGMERHKESLRVCSRGRRRLVSQLSKYAGLADQLEQHITTAKNKPAKPKLFGKLDL